MSENNFEYGFEKLRMYQLIRKLRVVLKKMTLTLPAHEKFELAPQISRAISGMASNIAEGSGRSSKKDQAHFTNMAYSSGLELVSHLLYAMDMEYISEQEHNILRRDLGVVNGLLSNLYFSQVNRKDSLGQNLSKETD
jgi:four helix bundle protein